jgi:hypothetical protein
VRSCLSLAVEHGGQNKRSVSGTVGPKFCHVSKLLSSLHNAIFLLYNTPARSQKMNCIFAGGRSAQTMITDLPAGMARLMQIAQGYVASMVSGEIVQENSKETGAPPGKVVRGTERPVR